MAIERLVDELDRSYAEAQERMSDPEVYNDHRQAADAWRRLKELEAPKRLADEWRQARDDLDAAHGDPELAGMAAELEQEIARLEDELKLALVERDPADEKDVIVEVRQGVGGDEAGLWAADVRRMARIGCEGPNQMKAFLRCGMGPCQGRMCGLTVTELIAAERETSPAEVGYWRLRPPVKPITLGEFASLPKNEAALRSVARG